MKFPSSVTGLRTLWRRHHTAIVLLLTLSIIAGVSRSLLRGEVGTGTGGSSSSSSSAAEQLRSCSSKGTVFEDMTSLKKVMETFQKRVSEVVKERETFLSSPSKWQCVPDKDGNIDAPMPKLQALADDMPGWHYQYVSPLDPASPLEKVQRPVSFGSFSSILGEFEREYECKLTEFQDRAFLMVLQNEDLDPEPRQFCCDQNQSCGEVRASSACTSPVTDDPKCGGACAVKLNAADMAVRPTAYFNQQLTERIRARTAVQRTIYALRSFEMNYVYAKQLTCFSRASLDLKNELSLLADATSCMPKIWDAVTSLHDPGKLPQ